MDANDRLSEARAETDRRMMDADKKLNRAKELKLRSREQVQRPPGRTSRPCREA